jgi:hypothetical protein
VQLEQVDTALPAGTTFARIQMTLSAALSTSNLKPVLRDLI